MEIDKKDLAALLLITLSGLFLRLPYLFQESVWNDETVYMWIGKKISENPGFLFTKYPAYHSYGYILDIIIALIHLLIRNIFFSGRLASFFLSFLGVILVYFSVKKIAGRLEALVAGLLLAFNPLHIFFSDRTLLDAPLSTALAFLAFSIIYSDEQPLLLLFSTLFTVFTKVSGILSAAIASCYSFFVKSKKAFLAFIPLLLFFFINWIFFGSPFKPGGANLRGVIFTGSKFFYVENSPLIYGSFVIFLLVLIGSYFSLSDKKLAFISAIFWANFLWFSFLVGEKVPRYVLQTVPLAIILAVYAVHELLKKLKLDPRLVLLLLLLLPGQVQQARALLQAKAYTYTGFQELGKKVAELDRLYNFSAIYCASTRQIRAFSGIEYAGDGGKIHPLPKNFEELANKSNILLQLDIWEYTAPDWAYPLTQEKLNRILAANFSIVHVVYRDVPTQAGLKKVAVGLLLIR